MAGREGTELTAEGRREGVWEMRVGTKSERGAAGYSRWQEEEQPSPSRRLPSSHSSGDSVRPLPQRGEAAMREGVSLRQVGEQPSLSKRLPSSHSSGDSRRLLPQTGTTLQRHRLSSHDQLKGQGKPTSHSSPASTLPSPQTVPATAATHRHCERSQDWAGSGQGMPISHSSVPSRRAFPQRERGFGLVLGVGERDEARAEERERIWHWQETVQKPPLGHGCPTSHCSEPSSRPLPHWGTCATCCLLEDAAWERA